MISLNGRKGESSACSGITTNPTSNNFGPGICKYVAKFDDKHEINAENIKNSAVLKHLIK